MTTPPTDQQLASDDRAIQVLSDQGAQCGDCGDEPGDRVCPDCEKYRRWYVDALRAAGWAPRDEVLREVADMADPAAPEVSFFGGMVGPSVAAWLRMLADRAARDAAPEATSTPLAASQPPEVQTEPETATEAPEGPPRDPLPDEEFTGTQPCGHDDYHSAHPWHDRPGLWCPGHSYDDDQAAAEEATR